MHILTLDYELPIDGGMTMQPGVEYILTNATCGLILDDHRRIMCNDGRERTIASIAHVRPATDIPFDPSKNWNKKTVHIFRGGGWGDIMMLSPLFRELRKRWPKVNIILYCAKEYQPAALGLGVEVKDMPVSRSDIKRGDAAVFFEGTIEYNPESETTHMLDMFAAKFGIEITDRSIDWVLTNEERVTAFDKFPRSLRKRIGVQVCASSPVRTYHPKMLSIVVKNLVELGHEVYLFARKGSVQTEIEGAVNLSDFDLTMRESVAVMTTCDVMLTPDSSLFHAAQALSIPVVALFGSFDASLRVTNPDVCDIIQAKGECAPCFFHSHLNIQFPSDKPCSIAGFCTVLAGINPLYIVERISLMLTHKDSGANRANLHATRPNDPVSRPAR